MQKKMLTNRLTGALAFFVVIAGLLFVTLRDGNAVEKTKKGWLGVSVQELTPSLRESMKVGNRSGLLITDVVADSPADDANLREEDVLLSFDGKAVEKADDFTQLVRSTLPDKKVKVKIMRNGEERELEVTVGARRSETAARTFSWSGSHSPNVMVWNNRPQLGVQVQDLNRDLAPYFKVEEKSGVLVLSVSDDSPAEKAGLKAGDVITRLGDEKITDADDLISALRDYEDGDKVNLDYVRQGKSANVQVELENTENSHGFQFFTPDRERNRIPEKSKIRIQSSDGDNDGGEAGILLQRHLEGLEKGRIERNIQNRWRDELRQLERLPRKINLRELQTI